jgi:hypothetical protein
MLTIESVKEYLGIDYSDAATERRLTHLIDVANKHLEGSLGVLYPKDDSRTIELGYMIIADLYDNRSVNDKISNAMERIVNDFSLQIRLQMKGGDVV